MSRSIRVICRGRVARVLADAGLQLERVAVDLCQDLAMAAGLP